MPQNSDFQWNNLKYEKLSQEVGSKTEKGFVASWSYLLSGLIHCAILRLPISSA